MAGRPKRKHQARAVLRTAPRAARGEKVTELQWQRRVEGLLSYYGWKFFHDEDSRRNRRGFPDVAAHRHNIVEDVHPDPIAMPTAEVLFAEIKGDSSYGRRGATREQRAWIEALQLAGIEAHIWHLPRDYDAMHARLARGRHRVEPEWAIGLLQEGLPLTLDDVRAGN